MKKLLIYYAHPGHRFSQVNVKLVDVARSTDGVTFVDLYAEYPRYDISIEREQARLVEHDVVIFQFPLFWYSTPSLLKEWIDLVLECGFAYGAGGDRLTGKTLLLAVTASGDRSAYGRDGYQRFGLREFLRPLEQTAALCHLRFAPPYVLYAALLAPEDGRLEPHVTGYGRLLAALRNERFDFEAAESLEVITFESLAALIGD